MLIQKVKAVVIAAAAVASVAVAAAPAQAGDCSLGGGVHL